MFRQFAAEVKDTARATARAAALSTMGTLFAVVGIGFLTVALWLFLVTLKSAIFAATVIGSLYCALGFILLAFASSGSSKSADATPEFSSGRSSNPPANETREPFLQMAEGFALGMQAGRSARR